MSYQLILAIVASLCVGGAAGAGITHYGVDNTACPTNTSWQKFMAVPPLDTTGKTYK